MSVPRRGTGARASSRDDEYDDSSAPPGQNRINANASTGFAALPPSTGCCASLFHGIALRFTLPTGCVAFHPWLHSGAPLGRRLMPGTYSQLLLHVVFSTKGRTPWIVGDVADRLYPYIGGIVRAEKGVLYDIGGVEDHVHLYLRWRPDVPVSDLMRTVKARSSKWIHDTFPQLGAFTWQEGYGVFSVSKSQEEAVKKYIAWQAEHHRKEDFKSELLRMLRAHGVEFDEKYVFE
jgi:putative transposase